jgi:hypothetical protein
MKKLILSIILSLFVNVAWTQTTTVTATPIYPDANNFANGTVLATFTPPTGIINQNLYLINGTNFPYYVSGTINGSGQFSIVLTDDHQVRPLGGRWMFTVCSAATVQCTNSLQDVFGASIDLSTLISVDVRAILASPSNDPIYFADSEVKTNLYGGERYFNYVSKSFRCWDGSVWTNCGSGGGGGGVIDFLAGNFDPLFTTNVTNPTTTPILTFLAENAPAHTVYANETSSSATPSFQTDALTINTTAPLTGGALVHLGSSITLSCPTCSVPQVNVTATSPIVVTPSPGVSTFVISCPTCGTSSGTLTNFSSGNLAPLFTTSVSNPTTTPALSFALSSVAPHTVYANETGSTTTPSFQTDLVTINTAAPLGGGGSLELGGTLSLTCTGCLTAIPTNNRTRTCELGPIGSQNAGAVLVTADIQPQPSTCVIDVPMTALLAVVLVNSGASTVQIGYRNNGATTAISPVLTPATVAGITDKVACANVGGTAVTIQGHSVTCSTLTNTALTQYDTLETIGGTADGVTLRMNPSLTMTVN